MANPISATTPEAGPAAPDPRRWLVLAVLGSAFFIVILDGTIVYVAVPQIQVSLGFTEASVQWVLSAYLLTFGGLLLFGGRLADLLGRRRIFMIGIALFTAASLLCGLAWSAEALIAFRVAQGAGAAIMAPTALSLVLVTFAEGPERNRALGIWGGIGGVGGTAGLLLGGPITAHLGWEWIFFMNVPIGLALLVLCRVLLRESRNPSLPRTFDVAGAVTVTSALVLLVYGITEAPAAGWASPRTWAVFAASAVLLAAFLLIEQRSGAPLVPLRIFRSRRLVGGNIVLLVAGMSVDGVLFILTLYAQRVLGASAEQFGLMTAVLTVMSVLGSFAGQFVVTKRGFRPVAAAGMALIGVGSLLLAQLAVDGGLFRNVFLGLLVFGTGLGAAFVGAQIAALSGVRDGESGLAAGIADTFFTIGGALGLAVLSTVAASRTAELLGTRAVDPRIAMTQGFQSALFVAVGCAFLGLMAALLLLGSHRRTTPAGGEVALDRRGHDAEYDRRAEARTTSQQVRNVQDALDSFSEHWQPRRLASVNDYDVKVVKTLGEFTWHSHPETDELFMVLSGRLAIQLRDGDVELGPGDVYVVPRGVEHCPKSEGEASAIFIEPQGIANTGDTPSERTAELRELD